MAVPGSFIHYGAAIGFEAGSVYRSALVGKPLKVWIARRWLTPPMKDPAAPDQGGQNEHAQQNLCEPRRGDSPSDASGGRAGAGQGLQGKDQIAHRLEPLFRFLFQAVIDDLLECLGDVGALASHLRGSFPQDRSNGVDVSLSAKGSAAG